MTYVNKGLSFARPHTTQHLIDSSISPPSPSGCTTSTFGTQFYRGDGGYIGLGDASVTANHILVGGDVCAHSALLCGSVGIAGCGIRPLERAAQQLTLTTQPHSGHADCHTVGEDAAS
jgi:hypothetical protein